MFVWCCRRCLPQRASAACLSQFPTKAKLPCTCEPHHLSCFLLFSSAQPHPRVFVILDDDLLRFCQRRQVGFAFPRASTYIPAIERNADLTAHSPSQRTTRLPCSLGVYARVLRPQRARLGSKADISSDPPSGLGPAYAQTQDYELAVVEPSARPPQGLTRFQHLVFSPIRWPS